jgi:hypothetical protein
MKSAAFLLTAIVLSSSAFAAGIDSRAYSCGDLHALIAAHGFVFIGNPDFQDFVVADASVCGGRNVLQLRSVATTDSPECLVNYCVPPHGMDGDRN